MQPAAEDDRAADPLSQLDVDEIRQAAARSERVLGACAEVRVVVELDVQPEPLEGKVIALPKADELTEGFEPQLIVEICAR